MNNMAYLASSVDASVGPSCCPNTDYLIVLEECLNIEVEYIDSVETEEKLGCTTTTTTTTTYLHQVGSSR